MKKNHSTVITIVLVVMIVLLLGAVFFVSSLISKDSTTPTAGTAKKVKAASQTYRKILSLRSSALTPSPTEIVLLSPTPSEGAQLSGTPPVVSPTSTLLAKNGQTSPSGTVAPTPTGSSQSISPTKVASLPQTGYMSNFIIVSTVSLLIIVFSFLF